MDKSTVVISSCHDINEYLEATSMLLSPHPLEDMISTLPGEDRIFGPYVNAQHLKQTVSVYIVHFRCH